MRKIKLYFLIKNSHYIQIFIFAFALNINSQTQMNLNIKFEDSLMVEK